MGEYQEDIDYRNAIRDGDAARAQRVVHASESGLYEQQRRNPNDPALASAIQDAIRGIEGVSASNSSHNSPVAHQKSEKVNQR